MQPKYRLSNFKRHYNVSGEDILATHDTAIAGLFLHQPVEYVSITVNKDLYDRLADSTDTKVVKHPGTGMDCLKVMENIYVRKQSAKINGDDVIWSKYIGCMVPTLPNLYRHVQSLLLSKSTTKKVLAFAERLEAAITRLAKTHGEPLV